MNVSTDYGPGECPGVEPPRLASRRGGALLRTPGQGGLIVRVDESAPGSALVTQSKLTQELVDVGVRLNGQMGPDGVGTSGGGDVFGV
ncbi:MAG: hypothetical protein HYT87_13950 [Nitrospirae bacterium]|nr:hypothetical protein [Nitrospirota bacterium]